MVLTEFNNMEMSQQNFVAPKKKKKKNFKVKF